jgi:fructose/tagatose bisphosphate aldolase
VVNIDSDLRIAFAAGIKKISTKTWANDPRTPLSSARTKMSEVAEAKIKLLN